MFLVCSVAYKPERTDRKRQRKIQWAKKRVREWARTRCSTRGVSIKTCAERQVHLCLYYSTQNKKRFVFHALWTVNVPLGFRPCHNSDCSWSSRPDRPSLLTSDCSELHLPEKTTTTKKKPQSKCFRAARAAYFWNWIKKKKIHHSSVLNDKRQKKRGRKTQTEGNGQSSLTMGDLMALFHYMVRLGSARFGTAWYGSARFAFPLCGTIRLGSARFDSARFGSVCFSTAV